MAALTAAGVLRALDRQRTQQHVAALADLDRREHDAVAEALEGVSPKAKIDIGLLVQTVRNKLQRRDAAEAERRQHTGADILGALRYGWSLKPLHELKAIRAELAARLDAGETQIDARTLAQIGAHTKPAAGTDIEPDPDLDDNPPRRRGGVRRLRLREQPERSEDALASVPATDPPASTRTRSAPRNRRFSRLLGNRTFADGYDLTPEPVEFETPPWIISDDDEQDTA